MTIITILLGLVGLGVVVFFHELGHFIMARLVGVEVEEFSLGWGPKLTGFKRGNTTYRLSVLPIGGYCRMKGEDSYRTALEQKLDDFPKEPGSYFAAHPLKRILIALGGPLLNVVFAFVVFTTIFGAGYTVDSWGTKLVLASDFDDQSYAADSAGFSTGDTIVSIAGKDIRSFSDIQEAFALSAEKTLSVVIERDGQRIETSVTPILDRETGAGRVGIYPWVEPNVARLSEGSPLRLAGLAEGDRIVAIDGFPIRHGMDFIRYLELKRPERPVLSYERSGAQLTATLVLSYAENGSVDLGLIWQHATLTIRSESALGALADGWKETFKTIEGTYRGLASLFKGVDVFRAVSGPARITWVVGQVATEGFSSGMASGLTVSFNFLAILSIGLFAMNLLPIPLLDGGWILLFIVEALRGKAAKVKTVFRYQTIGIVAVAGLFLMTTIADILFFSGR